MVFELLEGIDEGFDWFGPVAMDGEGCVILFLFFIIFLTFESSWWLKEEYALNYLLHILTCVLKVCM